MDDDSAEFDVIDGVRLVKLKPKPKKNKLVAHDNTNIHIEEIDGVPVVRVEQKFLKDRRPIWSDMEIRELISIMKEKEIMPLLSGRQYRRSDVFKIVADNMNKRGYKRTTEQVSIKWKHLRLCYFRSKSKYQTDDERKLEFPFYEEIDELFGGRKPADSFISIEQFNELLNRRQMQSVEIDGSKFFESNNVPTNPAVKVPTREEIEQARESSITSALESFTRNWQTMVLRVAEQEAEQNKIEKEKELLEQREWEEKLIEKQCAAMTRTNQEFLVGLKDIFQGLIKQ
ncbi:uncharacterized protein LOC129003241 [Macrosteles quadrilineatus]|uniref:uncharacterized protein LOC129003241 n=1 Tax=Macrosteles quadrilineatus TaxID=74068 RepID=UPI0023E10F93|nr:uncharacterized protein LOC129003241 [Macrosteles quadrilineatus]